MSDHNIAKVVEELTRIAIDKGQIIEAGWISLRALSVPPDAPQVQLEEMRNAFFAGAQHLFSSIMTVLDPDKEPTEKDLRRMSMIHSELEEFIRQYKLTHRLAP